MQSKCRCEISRRDFLRFAGGTAACCALLPLSESLLQAAPLSRTPIYAKGRAKVGLVFTHMVPGVPGWPSSYYDYSKRVKELTPKLVDACPNIEFTVKETINVDEANAAVKETAEVDGYLIYVIGLWTGAPGVFMHSGKPCVMADDLFAGSGETLCSMPAVRNEKLPVVVVSSSDFKDVVDAVRLFEPIRAMKKSTVLNVWDGDITAAAEQMAKVYGTKLVGLDSKGLSEYYSKADEREAAEWADYWIGNAKKMVEPTRDEIVKSGKMYLALAEAMSDRRADAVTMDCLGMFYTGRVTAYPCLSHFQMNNDGSTGVCESDLNSTCTQLLMRYLTGRPGYVSDPVIDTSTDEIIYAHCVAMNKVFGPKGKSNPYIIRSHAEDGKGAVVQSLMPAGEDVTTLDVDIWSKRLVLHTGKTTRNVDDPKACRTKLAARTNAQAILDNWDMGWHRVTVYGDWRKQVKDIAKLLGLAVFEEDKS